jgi:hypothetical protein
MTDEEIKQMDLGCLSVRREAGGRRKGRGKEERWRKEEGGHRREEEGREEGRGKEGRGRKKERRGGGGRERNHVLTSFLGRWLHVFMGHNTCPRAGA